MRIIFGDMLTADAVEIGKLQIYMTSNDKLWITHRGDGEGMQTDEAKLAEWLERFYRENF